MAKHNAKIRGNQTLSGTWAQVWVDGELIAECKKIEAKVSANREDIQIGADMDSKITSLKGEGSLTINKVYSRCNDILRAMQQGKDKRVQIIAKLADPDAVGSQIERYSINNVWFAEIPLISYERGAVIEEELSIGFTPSDVTILDEIN